MSKLVFLLFSCLAFAQRNQFRGDAVCRNHSGSPVDWWVIIKDEGAGMKYIYYDSLMAKLDRAGGRKALPMGLSESMRLDDPKSSPLIRTMYDSRPFSRKERKSRKMNSLGVKDRDNTVFLAINDQPPPLEAEAKGSDEEEEIIKGKDAYGQGVDERSAHTKLWMATQVEYPESDDDQDEEADDAELVVKSRLYVIQHSLPQFPWMPTASGDSEINRQALPDDPRDMFRSNATRPQAKAQHFFCSSYSTMHSLQKGQLAYRPNDLANHLQTGEFPLVSVLHYLRTVHAAIIGTNYVPWLPEMAVYHRFFDVRPRWSSDPIVQGADDFGSLNQPRTFSAQAEHTADGSPHLLPLWPTQYRYLVENGRITRKFKAQRSSSLRNSNMNFMQDCRVFNAQGRKDPACLGSTSITTTSLHYPIDINLLYKNGKVYLDIWDDLVAPLTVDKSFLAEAMAGKAGKQYHKSSLIVQSWMDHTTLGDHVRDLLTDKNPSKAAIWVKNSTGISLPEAEGGDKIINSAGQDHSKWAVGVRTGDLGTLPFLWCSGDLNRTKRHARLAKQDYGRGGGVWCTSNWALASLFWGLRPRVQSNADFASFDFNTTWGMVKGFEQKQAAVVRYHEEGRHYFIGHSHLKPNGEECLAIERYLSPFKPRGVEGKVYPILLGSTAKQVTVRFNPADIKILSDDDEDDSMEVDTTILSPTKLKGNKTILATPKDFYQAPVSTHAGSTNGDLPKTPVKRRKLRIKLSLFIKSLGLDPSRPGVALKPTSLPQTCPSGATLSQLFQLAGLQQQTD